MPAEVTGAATYSSKVPPEGLPANSKNAPLEMTFIENCHLLPVGYEACPGTQCPQL